LFSFKENDAKERNEALNKQKENEVREAIEKAKNEVAGSYFIQTFYLSLYSIRSRIV